MSVTADARGAPTRPPRRQWEFSATPPRRSASALKGRQDTRTVTVGLQVTLESAFFHVDGVRVARIPRVQLLAWLHRQGPRGPFLHAPLLIRDTDLGMWFELAGYTAPTVLTQLAIQRITYLLKF